MLFPREVVSLKRLQQSQFQYSALVTRRVCTTKAPEAGKYSEKRAIIKS